MDANRNRTEVAFDTLGLVIANAVKGKPEENLGDSLEGLDPDLTDATIHACFEDPLASAHALLGRATTRLVYDLFAVQRSLAGELISPAATCVFARETHDADLAPGSLTRVQTSVSYSDGFGRSIQKKLHAEPGPLVEGGPIVNPRWVGSGWAVFNNKGQPFRQYEPFFSARPQPDGTRRSDHRFEFGAKVRCVSDVRAA